MFVESGFGALLALLLVLVFSAIRILREYERGEVFQLGRFWRVKGPGGRPLAPSSTMLGTTSSQLIGTDRSKRRPGAHGVAREAC